MKGRHAYLFAVALASLLACRAEPGLCEVCRRTIHASVQATLELTDGSRVHACCPRCALHYREGHVDQVTRVQVTDHATGKAIALPDAYLVEGSDHTPCLEHHVVADDTGVPLRICYDRCMPSLIAFGSPEAAAAFQGAHGGSVIPPGGLAGRAPDTR